MSGALHVAIPPSGAKHAATLAIKLVGAASYHAEFNAGRRSTSSMSSSVRGGPTTLTAAPHHTPGARRQMPHPVRRDRL